MITRRVNVNTESVDNYLKAIFTLGGPREERVTSTALAELLGVAPASITNMLQKLAASPSPPVEYESRRGVRLSAVGRRRALEIVRHHRLLEAFLYQMLDYPSRRCTTRPNGWSISSPSASRSGLRQTRTTEVRSAWTLHSRSGRQDVEADF
jgi:Mn-dependent DtxR family transcriptional regulator